MTRIRKMKAVVCCTGESRIRPDRAELANVLKKDQNSAASACEKLLAAFPEGIRACAYGCLGGGSCEQVCRCHAIHISENGTARVDEEKCAGCGRCVKACPQHLIRLFPSEDSIRVLCSGRDPGKTARTVCGASCIGCGICEKNCPAGAIHVVDNCAQIDTSRYVSCGMCAVKCPRGVIHDRDGIFTAE